MVEIDGCKGNGGMGFRGISDFNLSLLGKQFWRILQGESSLLSQVSRVNISQGVLFKRLKLDLLLAISYIWKSILESRDLVMSGTRCRICDGSQVHVWRDNWILDNSGFEVSSVN
ncbi:unnamed protein product [Vicia faba]|uniref:Uncharacterized protein n=1 Tax=Vicia faba TaxID=3906 RepID=A0AAV0ZTG9_VICFA|nr:unnamed protein product [Vicia faba]